jgi:predicted TIM-barrel fold metal-dependent hydrolase
MVIQGVKVIDFHTHFPCVGSWFPDYRVLGELGGRRQAGEMQLSELWRKAYNFPQERVVIEDDAEASDRWYADVVDKQIDQVVFVSGGGNRRLANIVGRHPDRFIGFAHHHPFDPKAPEILDEAVTKLGLRGYKILGTAIGRPISDKALFPLWEVCRAHELPVLIHFGILGAAGGLSCGTNISPLSIHGAAKAFPEVRFVVPHFGAGYPTEALHLCWTCPNIHVDSSGSNQWTRWMAYDLSLQQLFRKFYETMGPERLLFATDSSWFPRTYAYTYLEEQHKIMRFLGFKDADIEMILYGNARRLLKLD